MAFIQLNSTNIGLQCVHRLVLLLIQNPKKYKTSVTNLNKKMRLVGGLRINGYFPSPVCIKKENFL